MTSKNLTAATAALTKALEDEVAADELPAYLAQVGEVVAALKVIREQHAKAIRVAASTRSRAKRKERIAAGLALLDAKEKGAAK